MRIINLAGAKQGFEGVIARNQKSGEVDQKLASNVEEDEEEVQANDTEESIDLRNGGLLLKVVEGRILGKLD